MIACDLSIRNYIRNLIICLLHYCRKKNLYKKYVNTGKGLKPSVGGIRHSSLIQSPDKSL